ncbi:recombinase family protein [Streptomyces nigrescens]|uniref:recombinase family protein n=1 Tax=Streptomyces nigrescens TaxID=1920 RepID=UPI0036CAFF35
MGDGRGDVEGRQQGPITLSLVNRRLEEHDKDITRFRRPRTPSFSPPLAALLASAAGARIGYARVFTKGQLLDQMVAALEAAGCARTFADKKSGKNAEREELWAALDQLRPGDTLVVPALDRLGRSIQDLISIVGGLRRREIGFRSLHEALDTTTPGGRLVFHVSPRWRLSQARRSSRAVTWAARSRTLSSAWPLNVFEARSARADRY